MPWQKDTDTLVLTMSETEGGSTNGCGGGAGTDARCTLYRDPMRLRRRLPVPCTTNRYWIYTTAVVVSILLTLEKPSFTMASFLIQTQNYDSGSRQRRSSNDAIPATTPFDFKVRNDGILFVSINNSPSSSSSSATGTTSITIDDDDDDDMYIYPPRQQGLFQDTNIISRTMSIPESPFWETLLPPPPFATSSSSSSFAFVDDIVDTNRWIANVFGRNESNKDGGGGGGRKSGKMSHDKGGIDETIEFTDAGEGATALVRQCLETISSSSSSSCPTVDCECDELGRTDGREQTYDAVTRYLKDILSYYQDTIEQQQQQLEEDQFSYKARLVSSSGPVGQKCPRWHVDHVPVRLVMSLVGPGCVYISHEAEFRHTTISSSSRTERMVDREALNELIEFDTNKANRIILPSGEDGLAVTASPGEAILMMGRGWEEGADGENGGRGSALGQGQMDRPTVGAAPHRSPDLGPWERRVLLTVDIVPRTLDYASSPA